MLTIGPLKKILAILILWVCAQSLQAQTEPLRFDFLGEKIEFQADSSLYVNWEGSLTAAGIRDFYDKINQSAYTGLIESLVATRDRYKLDDWLFYQLIRRTAQGISPKYGNYARYTLYKWFFLVKSGYNSIVTVDGERILFYIQTDENVYNIPYRVKEGKQYVCLNYHDYGQIDFTKTKFSEVDLPVAGANRGFTYKVTHMPDLGPATYQEKDIAFNYYEEGYHFKIKLSTGVKALFTNYPVVDYGSYFNTPLSGPTYTSLIPELKKRVKGLNKKKGVEFLMNFTRYAFLYEPDINIYGGEKRLTPEQTLLSDQSDCDDRAALFFYLIKEIYDLPMLVISYPTHVTIAVAFDKPIGQDQIDYAGKKYSICEPTPQKTDLKIGQLPPQFVKAQYEIAYAYMPAREK